MGSEGEDGGGAAVITVTINGDQRELQGALCLADFLKERGLDRQFVAVAHNGNVLQKSDYPRVTLQDGDVLEIVRPVGGG